MFTQFITILLKPITTVTYPVVHASLLCAITLSLFWPQTCFCDALIDCSEDSVSVEQCENDCKGECQKKTKKANCCLLQKIHMHSLMENKISLQYDSGIIVNSYIFKTLSVPEYFSYIQTRFVISSHRARNEILRI